MRESLDGIRFNLDDIRFNGTDERIKYSVAVQDLVDEFKFYGDDIIENPMIVPTDYDDCYLSAEELKELSTPAVQKWKDQKAKLTGEKIKFTIDSCKLRAWDLTKKEITHVRNRLLVLTKKSSNEGVTNLDILDLLFGENSAVATILMRELEIDHPTFMKFMATFCLQAAYRTSVTETYGEASALRDKAAMDEEDYLDIWKKIAKVGEQNKNVSFVGQGRREAPLWEMLETGLNEICKSLSITNRKGTISIALDDDKIWLSQTGKNGEDKSNLNYTTHVRDNRKGIIAHTAVSSGANLPLGMYYLFALIYYF